MVRFNFFAVLALAWVLCSGCAATKPQSQHTVQNTICENHCFAGTVLLATENSQERYLKNYYYPLWMPSTNAINEALSQVTNYLQHAETEPLSHPAYANELPGVRERLPKTVCQAVGVSCNGRKGILLNCFPSEGRWHERWRDGFIKVFDGGPRYWSVVYLTDEHRFTDLRIDLGFF
jgi:hypothetical protein